MADGSSPPKVSLLVTDLDNTLWDWFSVWHASFTALLAELARLSGVPISTLENEIRSVHQLRGTTEYSDLLNELPSLKALSDDPTKDFDEALHAQNSARKRNMRLYPGVLETLRKVRQQRVPIVAYTESLAFWTEWRIKRVGLDGIIDVLYSAPDHDLPTGRRFEDLRKLSQDSYGLKFTVHRHVPRGATKPAPDILEKILSDLGRSAAETAYVGDSLFKDVKMAQAVGAVDVYAKYGVVQNLPEYDLLRRLTNWSADAVEAERQHVAGTTMTTPSYTLRKGFSELLNILTFEGR